MQNESKRVPFDPTPEMMKAAQKADMDHGSHKEWLEFVGGDLKRIFKAMVQAAPNQDSEEERYKRMFEAACCDLGAIAESLGIDPDDGGAEPILYEIAELKAKLLTLPVKDATGEH